MILDQRVAAGIGNWMADEILYQSKIHPQKKVGDLTDKQVEVIYHAMKEVIETAIEKEAFYQSFPKHYFIHIRREGATCHHTQANIEKLTVGGRSTYYSPLWQVL